MRKIYILAAILFTTAAVKVNAQLKYGVSAGVNYSTFKGDAMTSFQNLTELTNGIITSSPKVGFHAGGFIELPLGDKVSLSPGIYYSQKGYMLRGNLAADKLDFLGVEAKAELQSHYIDMPVLIKAEVAKGLQLYAGPQLSYLLKNAVKMDAGLLGFSLLNTNVDVTNQFNKADFAIAGGASYTFDNGFSINAGYDHGLSRLDKNSNFKSYNRNFKVGIGYKF